MKNKQLLLSRIVSLCFFVASEPSDTMSSKPTTSAFDARTTLNHVRSDDTEDASTDEPLGLLEFKLVIRVSRGANQFIQNEMAGVTADIAKLRARLNNIKREDEAAHNIANVFIAAFSTKKASSASADAAASAASAASADEEL